MRQAGVCLPSRSWRVPANACPGSHVILPRSRLIGVALPGAKHFYTFALAISPRRFEQREVDVRGGGDALSVVSCVPSWVLAPVHVGEPVRARHGSGSFARVIALVRVVCASATSRSARALASSIRKAAPPDHASTPGEERLLESACAAAPSLASPRRDIERDEHFLVSICPGVTDVTTVPGTSLRMVIERSANTVPIASWSLSHVLSQPGGHGFYRLADQRKHLASR